MDCIICENKFSENVLFENNEFIVMLATSPAINGHIQIYSKEHNPIMEQISDKILGNMMIAANKVSMILFEVLNVHGTNIIINNGVPAGQKVAHFSIDIIPRRTDDGLKLDWTLKQATPEALDSIHRIIGEGMNKPDNKIIDLPNNKNDFSNNVVPLKSTIENNNDDEPNTMIDDVTEEKHEHNNNGDDNHSNKLKDKPLGKTNYYHKLFERIP